MFVQIDHREPWAKTKHTRLDELDPLCPHDHDLKTNQGWSLVEGPGRRAVRRAQRSPPPPQQTTAGHQPTFELRRPVAAEARSLFGSWRRGADDKGFEKAPRGGLVSRSLRTTGEGERYFDGKKWGTNEKPFGRHTTATIEPTYKAARTASGRARRLAPLVRVRRPRSRGVGIPKLRGSHDGNTADPRLSTPPTTIAPDQPPPPSEEAAQPLGAPPVVPAGAGKFEVAIDQPGDPTVPVAWDPCRPIHYVVNPAGAPSDGAVR